MKDIQDDCHHQVVSTVRPCAVDRGAGGGSTARLVTEGRPLCPQPDDRAAADRRRSETREGGGLLCPRQDCRAAIDRQRTEKGERGRLLRSHQRQLSTSEPMLSPSRAGFLLREGEFRCVPMRASGGRAIPFEGWLR